MIFPAAALPDGRHFLFGQRRLFMVSGIPMTAELFARIESQTIARQRVIVRLPTVNGGSTQERRVWIARVLFVPFESYRHSIVLLYLCSFQCTRLSSRRQTASNFTALSTRCHLGFGTVGDRGHPMATSRRTFLGVTVGAAALTMVRSPADAFVLSDQNATPPPAAPALVRVRAAPAEVINSFDPDQALATSMDIQSRESINRIYTPENVKVCLSAGWGPISYRLHTPETIDYWHWNPNGRWTDEANQRGYFVGSSELGEPIRDSF